MNTLRRLITCAAIAFLAASCSAPPKKTLTQASVSALRGKQIAVVIKNPPPLTVQTRLSAATTLLSPILAAATDSTIRSTNSFPQPAEIVAEELSATMVRDFQTTSMPARRVEDTALERVAIEHGNGAQAVLYVDTWHWGFGYLYNSLAGYKVTLYVRAHLIDTASGNTLASHYCIRSTPEDETPPTYDDLVNNNADLLKSTFARWSHDCAKSLASDALGIKQ